MPTEAILTNNDQSIGMIATILVTTTSTVMIVIIMIITAIIPSSKASPRGQDPAKFSACRCNARWSAVGSAPSLVFWWVWAGLRVLAQTLGVKVLGFRGKVQGLALFLTAFRRF